MCVCLCGHPTYHLDLPRTLERSHIRVHIVRAVATRLFDFYRAPGITRPALGDCVRIYNSLKPIVVAAIQDTYLVQKTVDCDSNGRGRVNILKHQAQTDLSFSGAIKSSQLGRRSRPCSGARVEVSTS